jgi:hypothetical protein
MNVKMMKIYYAPPRTLFSFRLKYAWNAHIQLQEQLRIQKFERSEEKKERKYIFLYLVNSSNDPKFPPLQ